MEFTKLIIFTMAITTVTAQSGFSQDETAIVESTVDRPEVEGHIWFLASDFLRGRDTGSPEIDIAAEYIASRLRSYGVQSFGKYEGYFQSVPLEKVKPPSEGQARFADQTYEIGKQLLAMQPVSVDADAAVFFSEYAMPDELAKVDLTGKIVIARSGSPEITDPRSFFGLSQQKSAAAQKQGAVALIELYSSPSVPWSLLLNFLNRERISLGDGEDSEEEGMPHFWLNDPENELFSKIKETKKPTMAISLKIEPKALIQASNVIGFVEGTDEQLKSEFVVLSAHYDHIGTKTGTNGEDSIFNGARDNAVGTAALLAAARSIGSNPLRRSVIFMACTGEEKGLLGSRHFVNDPPIPLSDMVFNLNTDGGGYNDIGKVSVFGLNRTTATPQLVSAIEAFDLEPFADPAPEQNLFDRSDNVNFAAKGIPAPTFSTGLTSFDEEINKYYHQVTDNPETLDYDYLIKYFKAYVLAARLIGNMEDTPFWVEGDKYEAAGKELYSEKFPRR